MDNLNTEIPYMITRFIWDNLNTEIPYMTTRFIWTTLMHGNTIHDNEVYMEIRGLYGQS